MDTAEAKMTKSQGLYRKKFDECAVTRRTLQTANAFLPSKALLESKNEPPHKLALIATGTYPIIGCTADAFLIQRSDEQELVSKYRTVPIPAPYPTEGTKSGTTERSQRCFRQQLLQDSLMFPVRGS